MLKTYSRLEHYKPFDMVASEFSCGFILNPYASASDNDEVYLHDWEERGLVSLELNFEGYVTMLYEARAYKNWPYILLALQEGEQDNALITEFKTHMPQLFDDFSWEDFVQKYESLRLSKS